MKHLVLSAEEVTDEGLATLSGDSYHYLVRVRRTKIGDQIPLLVGAASGWGRVISLDQKSLQMAVTLESIPKDEIPPIYLFPALLKGTKLDDVIRHGVECGAAGIFPFQAEHSISRLSKEEGAKKLTRWRTLVQEGVQQSGSPFVPEVGYFQTAEDVLAFWNDRGLLLYFHQTPLEKESLHGYLSTHDGPIALIIGPEGGLSSHELKVFGGSKGRPAWLGSRVLRAETASLFALAAVRIILEERASWKTL